MRLTTLICTVLVSVLVMLGGREALAQNDESDTTANDQSVPMAIAVTGHPFSATKYTRTVRITPDGSRTVIAERHSIGLARDSEGRIRIEGAETTPECERPGMLVLLRCPAVLVLVFDPSARILSDWLMGAESAPEAGIHKLTPEQFAECERLTLSTAAVLSAMDPAEANIVTEDLGQKVIEGIATNGVRTTTMLLAEDSNEKPTVKRIHEVWTSGEMKLVIKVIDGDPHGEETISGLKQISMTPDPSLFSPPNGYAVYDARIVKFIHSWAADEYVRHMTEWQVK
jgi:hypothetical protein